MIQESINQMIGTIGLATKLNPELEKKQEMKNLKAGEEALQKEANVVNKERAKAIAKLSTTTQKRSELHAAAADVEEKQYENYKRQFELDPSSDRLNKMLSAQRQANLSRTTANELAKLKIENAVKQDQEFKDLRDSIIVDKSGNTFKVDPKKLMEV